ncbi:MAG: 50S ribosomal protein L23 [Patescibacteria group bacterium]
MKTGAKSLTAYRVLVKPMITEKAAHLGTENKYVFMVSLDANKIEVAKAVNSVYGVKVEKVNLIRCEGKAVVRGRVKGKKKDFKKAIVTLAKGSSISIYEGV